MSSRNERDTRTPASSHSGGGSSGVSLRQVSWRGAARQLSSVSAVVRTAKTNERLNRTGQFYYAIIARCVRTAPPRRRCDLGVTVACQRPVDLCSTDTVTASPAAAAAAAVPRAS